MKKLLFSILIFFVVISCLHATDEIKIKDIKISTPIIDPSKGEKCTVSYKLSQNSPVTIKIYDENNYLVRTLVENRRRKAGHNEEIWDGRDDRRKVLPPEAYTFTIEGKDFIYDPVSFSGGERIRNLNASAHRKPPYSISYKLPVSARVRIRVGIKSGPLYRTLIDWKPKPSGSYTEKWNGKDKKGNVELGSSPLCFISVEAFSLPENTIIVTGTSQSHYGRTEETLIKREIDLSSRELYEHAQHPRSKCKDPEIEIILPEGLSYADDGLPIISGECSLKVKIDDADLKWLKEENPEYIFYMDDAFLFEEYEILPVSILHWDSSKQKNGKHLITINLRTFNDHCAIGCMWVYVKNKD